MKLYKCIISGDEMFSDVYKIKLTEDGIFYEVDGKRVTRKDDDIDEALFGANASADEPAEQLDSSSVSGIDIVLNHHLVETSYNKKQYMVYIKDYVKNLVGKLKDSNPDRVEGFKKGASEAVKKILAGISDYEFFIGESMNPDGMVALLNYRDDGITPYMLFFKDGLEEEKL